MNCCIGNCRKHIIRCVVDEMDKTTNKGNILKKNRNTEKPVLGDFNPIMRDQCIIKIINVIIITMNF